MRGRISGRRLSRLPLARARAGARRRARGERPHDPGLSPRPRQTLAPCRPRAFQPGRESQGSRPPVRLHGDLHAPPVGAGAAAPPPARPGAARIRRRGQQGRLLSLLLPVQRATESCAWLKAMVDAGEIFHPLRWTPREALALLRDVHALERPGIVVRVPAGWKTGRPPSPSRPRSARRQPAGLGLDALLDFRMDVTLDGETLTPEEIARCSGVTDGLAMLRGRWVEVDRERLRGDSRRVQARRTRRREGRPDLRRGDAPPGGRGDRRRRPSGAADASWGTAAGPWLAEALAGCAARNRSRRPTPATRWAARSGPTSRSACAGSTSCRELGPRRLPRRRHGARQDHPGARPAPAHARRARANGRPSLLVVPASLLANWTAEAERFAPSLRLFVAHPLRRRRPIALKALAAEDARRGPISCVTTYGSLARVSLAAASASGASSCSTRRRRSRTPARSRRAPSRRSRAGAHRADRHAGREPSAAICGRSSTSSTPGLLGSAKQFADFDQAHGRAASTTATRPLRTLVRALHPAPPQDRPARHRRSARQDRGQRRSARSDQDAGRALPARPSTTWRARSSERRGHRAPRGSSSRRSCASSRSATTRRSGSATARVGAEASGKFARLREIAETIAARQEKVLVFTQFREMTEPLAALLARRLRPAGPRPSRRHAGRQRRRPGRGVPGRRAARPSSSSRSRPAARAST